MHGIAIEIRAVNKLRPVFGCYTTSMPKKHGNWKMSSNSIYPLFILKNIRFFRAKEENFVDVFPSRPVKTITHACYGQTKNLADIDQH